MLSAVDRGLGDEQEPEELKKEGNQLFLGCEELKAVGCYYRAIVSIPGWGRGPISWLQDGVGPAQLPYEDPQRVLAPTGEGFWGSGALVIILFHPKLRRL